MQWSTAKTTTTATAWFVDRGRATVTLEVLIRMQALVHNHTCVIELLLGKSLSLVTCHLYLTDVM